MIQKNTRPIYLNILTIRFPITAIVSIIHRISGVLLFITIGPTLWLLQSSLSSRDMFYKINNFLLVNNNFFKFLLWNIFTTLSYHIIAGIRQILMDFGFLDQTWAMGKFSAKIVFVLVTLLFILSGILIWDPLNQF